MGTGYTRNDTANNIADGNVINAADFDGEYDAIEAAFNSSTGHTHDGTSAEGAPITVIGPSQEFVASSSEVKPSTNAGLDLGTSALKFKDLYLDGTAYIDGLGGDILAATDKKIQFRDTAIFINSSADGQLDIDADTTIELNSPEVIATDNFRLKSDAAILTFGADNDVTVTHVADTGLDAKAASGFALKLQTGDTTIESGNTLGKISFNAPDEASGTDAILVGAEIEAAAEATFSSTVNSTALVFKTNESAAATERMRIKSDGDIVIKGASYDMTWDASDNALEFADNAKATFGADADLQIFHLSSNNASYIQEQNGSGSLYIEGADVYIRSYSEGDNMIVAERDGAVTLYYDNSATLATTTDGVDVTGTLTATSLVSTNGVLELDDDGSHNGVINSPASLRINVDSDNGGTGESFQVGHNQTTIDTNNILFKVQDDGLVAIGTDSPATLLHLESDTPVITLRDTSAYSAGTGPYIQFQGLDSGSTNRVFGQIYGLSNGSNSGELAFYTRNSGSTAEAMRINSGGNLLIGYNDTFQNAGHTGAIQVTGQGTSDYHGATISINGFSNNSNGAYLNFGSGRSNTAGTYTSVANDDTVGQINFSAADGTDMNSRAAHITTQIDGAPSGNDTPGRIMFSTSADGSASPTERMRIDSAGNVGINTTTPSSYTANGNNLVVADVNVGITLASTSTVGSGALYFADGTSGSQAYRGIINYLHSSDAMGFHTGAAQAMTIDSSQRVLIGVTSARTEFFDSAVAPILQVESNSSNAAISITRNDNSGDGPSLLFGRARGTAYQIVQDGDRLGRIPFQGADGTDFEQSVSIDAHVDGSPASEDMPGRLVFSTTPDGTNATVERMRITNEGYVGINSSGNGTNRLAVYTGTSNGADIAHFMGYEFGLSTLTIQNAVGANNGRGISIDMKAGNNDMIGRLTVAHAGSTNNSTMNINVEENNAQTTYIQLQGDGQRINFYRDLRFANSGDGINFGATSGGGSTSTILDDYEEGTWTATFSPSSGFTPTANTQTGYYTKIGRQVTVTCIAKMTTPSSLGSYSSGSTSFDVRVDGLPFNVGSSTQQRSAPVFGVGNDIGVSNGYLAGHGGEGTDRIFIYQNYDNGSTRASPILYASRNVTLHLCFTYFTD